MDEHLRKSGDMTIHGLTEAYEGALISQNKGDSVVIQMRRDLYIQTRIGEPHRKVL